MHGPSWADYSCCSCSVKVFPFVSVHARLMAPPGRASACPLCRPQFAERLLETRLQVFKDWSKQFQEGKMEQRLKDSDLRVLRHQLNQTVRLSSDRPEDSIPETRE